MAKKRNRNPQLKEESGQDSDQRPFKRQKQSAHDTPSTTKSASIKKRPTQPFRNSAALDPRVSETPASAQPAILGDPPPGMNRRDRRRWQSRQLKRASSIRSRPDASSNVQAVAKSLDADDSSIATKPKSGDQRRSVKRIDPALLQRASCTKLVMQPKKRWAKGEQKYPRPPKAARIKPVAADQKLTKSTPEVRQRKKKRAASPLATSFNQGQAGRVRSGTRPAITATPGDDISEPKAPIWPELAIRPGSADDSSSDSSSDDGLNEHTSPERSVQLLTTHPQAGAHPQSTGPDTSTSTAMKNGVITSGVVAETQPTGRSESNDENSSESSSDDDSDGDTNAGHSGQPAAASLQSYGPHTPSLIAPADGFVEAEAPITTRPPAEPGFSDSIEPSSAEEEEEGKQAVPVPPAQPRASIGITEAASRKPANPNTSTPSVPSIEASLQSRPYGGINYGFASRPLIAQKANSVPTASRHEDVRSNFKRFSAFLRGRNADSSEEDEDDEDESEDDSACEFSSDAGAKFHHGESKQVPEPIRSGTLPKLEANEASGDERAESASVSDHDMQGLEDSALGAVAGIHYVQAEQEANKSGAGGSEDESASSRDSKPDDDAQDAERQKLGSFDISEDVTDEEDALEVPADDGEGESKDAAESDDEQQSEQLTPSSQLLRETAHSGEQQPMPTDRDEENALQSDKTSSLGDDRSGEKEASNIVTARHPGPSSSNPRESHDEIHSSQQPQATAAEDTEMMTDDGIDADSGQEEEDTDSEDEGDDGTQEVIDSPMQPLQTSIVTDVVHINQDAASPTQTTFHASTWPANVGKKRQASFLGRPTGGTGFVRAPPNDPSAINEAAAPFTFTQDDDDNDDDDVFKTIDEIAEDVFGFTRPLPPSKPRQRSRDHEDARLTNYSSDDGLRPVRICRRVAKEVLIPRPPTSAASDTIVCYSVLVPEIDGVVVNERGSSEDAPVEPEQQVDVSDSHALPSLEQGLSSSSLSELGQTPSPPPELLHNLPTCNRWHEDEESEPLPAASETKKRRMTGMTSKHFSPIKRTKRKQLKKVTVEETSAEVQQGIRLEEAVDAAASTDEAAETTAVAQGTSLSTSKRSARAKRKSTGKKSEHFMPLHLLDRVDLPTPSKGRVPAGTSRAPVPSIKSERFGIIQEKLWDQPFWLLIAVTFLNKTTGRAAVPTFWALRERYPTPEVLANAEQQDVHDMIQHLGLQNQRSKRLIVMSKAWLAQEPVAGRRYKTVNYPIHGDHKEYNKVKVVEGDATDCKGALEIGYLPGCGTYAWDSWRIFCRDVLRGVAEDYNGRGAPEGFQPEWRRVLPMDKELRATLRWMWLREGWIWNHESGEKREATDEEMERAVLGEMDVPDAQERKFAAQAAGVDTPKDAAVAASNETPKVAREEIIGEAVTNEASENISEEIVVSPRPKPDAAERKRRRTTIA